MPIAGLKPESSAPKRHLTRTTYRLIADKGVHRVSFEAIAAAAQVSKGIVLLLLQDQGEPGPLHSWRL
jgi:AcrR family transcriptional regulator